MVVWIFITDSLARLEEIHCFGAIQISKRMVTFHSFGLGSQKFGQPLFLEIKNLISFIVTPSVVSIFGLKGFIV